MQRRMFGRIIALAGFFLLVGVAGWAKPVTIEKTEYKGWKDAYRLTNGTVEVVVVPSIGGRIMRYAYVGGSNILWENPTVAGKLIPADEWPNTGGDKVWPWNQDDWPKLIGRGWPPPPTADQLPQKAEIIQKDTLRITSEPVAPWGARIVRDIRLAGMGTEVFLTSRFERVTEGPSYPIGVWTITQVPASPWVMARLTPAAATLENGYKPMSDRSFPSVQKMVRGVLLVTRDPANSAKIGTDADLLASLQNDTLFTVRQVKKLPADNQGLTYQSAQHAQFYHQPADEGAQKLGILPYIEMEMTSPQRVLGRKGETITLEQVWQLQRLPETKRTPVAVAALISRS